MCGGLFFVELATSAKLQIKLVTELAHHSKTYVRRKEMVNVIYIFKELQPRNHTQDAFSDQAIGMGAII